jgi:hypothetical protein
VYKLPGIYIFYWAIALVENPFYTIKLSFNVSGSKAGKILSTAWLFKLSCHRVLSRSKELLDALIRLKLPGLRLSTVKLETSYLTRDMLMELYTWSTAFGRALGG